MSLLTLREKYRSLLSRMVWNIEQIHLYDKTVSAKPDFMDFASQDLAIQTVLLRRVVHSIVLPALFDVKYH